MGQLLEQAYNAFGEEAQAARHRLPAGHRGEAGDRLGRRPRAPDHLEPALERLPMDPRRRADRARAGRENGRVSVAVEDTGPGSRRRSASGSSGRSGHRTEAGRASGLRSRASWPSRSAAAIRLKSTLGEGSRFELVLPTPRAVEAGEWPARLAAAVGARARCASRRCGRGSGRRTCSLRRDRLRGEARRRRALGEARRGFVAYCAASSAAYIVNDVRDAEHDRLHPLKRRRPIARGELPPRAALAARRGARGSRRSRVGRGLGLGSLGFLRRVRRAPGGVQLRAQARRARRRHGHRAGSS